VITFIGLESAVVPADRLGLRQMTCCRRVKPQVMATEAIDQS